MDKLTTIRLLLGALDMPKAQQGDLCAYTLLALARIKETDPYNAATNQWIRIHDIIVFLKAHYGITYAENSRETIRKQALHHFRTAALIEDNGRPTNSPQYAYRLTLEFLEVMRNLMFSPDEKLLHTQPLIGFKTSHQSLRKTYASKKRMQLMPVKINNADYQFSPGAHNQLQKAIIEDFAPRFAPNAQCLYVGDTTKKDMVKNTAELQRLGFDITLHDKMPDVVLYREDKDWLYFIEAVDSVGPMNAARVNDLQEMTKGVKSGKIFVTAFLSFDKYHKFAKQLAWETEVWIADMPDHMIHLNGDKFIGPR